MKPRIPNLASPRLVTVLFVTVSVLGLGACSLLETSYEPGELDDVMRGRVPSHADRYRIPLPTIAASRGNTAIARDGSLFVVLVGKDLKRTLAGCEPGDELGVQLVRTGQRHLVVERVFRGGETVDLASEGFRYRMPRFVTASEIPREKFEHDVHLCMIPPEDRVLGKLESHRIQVSEFSVERRAKAESEDGASETPAGSRYYLTSRGSDYVIANRDPMTLMMLDFLISEKREFEGGIRLDRVYDRSFRTSTRVAGEVNVRWIGFGGLYFRASA